MGIDGAHCRRDLYRHARAAASKIEGYNAGVRWGGTSGCAENFRRESAAKFLFRGRNSRKLADRKRDETESRRTAEGNADVGIERAGRSIVRAKIVARI